MRLSISHHLDDATVLAHASGTLPGMLKLVADAHLEICSHCRVSLRSAKEIGGAVLADVVPLVVSNTCKDKVLSLVGSATVHRLPIAKRVQPGDMPRAVQALAKAETLDQLVWRKSAPGVQTAKLPIAEGGGGFFGFLKIAPGSAIPEHGHGGSELTLVLRGAYEDAFGRFGPGDIADHDEGIEHEPRVVGDEPCICLVANYAVLKFRSWPARLVQRFVGI